MQASAETLRRPSGVSRSLLRLLTPDGFRPSEFGQAERLLTRILPVTRSVPSPSISIQETRSQSPALAHCSFFCMAEILWSLKTVINIHTAFNPHVLFTFTDTLYVWGQQLKPSRNVNFYQSL